MPIDEYRRLDRLHISVLTLGEIEQGIARIWGRGNRRQAYALERWLRDMQAGFEERILPVTLPIATAWGPSAIRAALPVIDALIAATAWVHGLTVVTPQRQDFKPAEVDVFNPFDE